MSGRTYRGTWLLVGVPMLLAAFSVVRPEPLAPPPLPPVFDGGTAATLAAELATRHPDRSPGSAGALGASQWVATQLGRYGFAPRFDRFTAEIPGRGRVTLENVSAVVAGPGTSPATIVVMAHRDNLGEGPGANDNASGTAALVELARAYAPPTSTVPNVEAADPAYRIVFLSTDGGAFGNLGAAHFATRSPFRDEVIAVLNLDSLAGERRARLHLAADRPRSPSPVLVATAADRVLEATGDHVERPSALRQLIDLGFPFTLHAQGPFLAQGIPAVTLSTAGDRPPAAFADEVDALNTTRLTELGTASQSILSSLGAGLELARGTSSYIYLGDRLIPGWAVQLVLVAMLAPFLAAVVDLFARCRRRRVPLGPAFRSFRSRLGFWLYAGLVFAALALVGAWPDGPARPISPETAVAGDWAAPAVAVFGVALLVGWFVARERLLPRRPVEPEEELAGHTAALLALALVALLTLALNPYSLLFLLPSLHAWLWLPNLRDGPAWARGAVLALGFAGPALVAWSFGVRFGLGFDTPWYLVALTAVGYVAAPAVLVTLAWAAAAGQFAALTAGRYAPYPPASERPPRGPVREIVRRLLLLVLRRRAVARERLRALSG